MTNTIIQIHRLVNNIQLTSVLADRITFNTITKLKAGRSIEPFQEGSLDKITNFDSITSIVRREVYNKGIHQSNA